VEWRNLYLKLAKEDVVRKFYEEKVPPMLDPENVVQVETYKTQRLLSLGKTDETRNYVYALVLGNNLHVPVRKSDAVAEELEEGSETMWSIDRKIAFGKLEADVVKTVDYKDFEEIYQHLRFSFSNWYALMDSPTLKK
jgi:FKBP-type peptidyl-prolyl cis-trans isomerase 2